MNTQDYITSVSYFPSGESIAVGTQNGKCLIYECKVNLKQFINLLNEYA